MTRGSYRGHSASDSSTRREPIRQPSKLQHQEPILIHVPARVSAHCDGVTYRERRAVDTLLSELCRAFQFHRPGPGPNLIAHNREMNEGMWVREHETIDGARDRRRLSNVVHLGDQVVTEKRRHRRDRKQRDECERARRHASLEHPGHPTTRSRESVAGCRLPSIDRTGRDADLNDTFMASGCRARRHPGPGGVHRHPGR